MTGIWPPAVLPGLHIDLGQHTRPWSPEHGYWVRPPTADHRCPCGWTTSATGPDVLDIDKAIAAHNCKPQHHSHHSNICEDDD